MAEFNGILYRKAGGTIELNRSVGSFCVVESAKLEDKWQDGGVVTLVLQTTEVLTFYSGDYIIARGNRYLVCKTISEYRTLDDGRHQYTVPLHSPDALFKNALMYNTMEHEDGGVYSWSRPNNFIMELGSVEVLVKTCCYNVNEVMGSRVFKLGTIDASVNNEYRVINFSDRNCFAALKQTCEDFDTFYTIRVNTDETPDSDYIVDIGVEPGTFPETLQVGMRQGIAELTMNYADEGVYTQFVVLGSSENLPRGYEHERLQLDEDLMGTPPVYAGSLIVDESKYARWGRKRMELIFDDIKPTRTGTITSIPEDNIFAFYDTSLSEVLAVEENWNPVGGTVHILDGNLLGYTFEIMAFHSGTYKITIKQISDSNGLLLPNADNETFRFSAGMKYNLAGIALPNSYVVDAKTRLKAAAVNAINGYWTQPRASFSLTPDPFFLREKETDISCGWLIPIKHDALEIDKSIRVTSVTYDLLKDTYFDIDSVEVADITGKDNFMNSVHRQIATTRSIVNGTGARNVYEAKMISRQRILDDYAKSQNLPNWATFMEILSSGKGLWKDEDGEWWLNVNAIKAGAISATMINVNDLIVKCLLTDVDDQGFRFDIRTINIDNDQVSQFRLYDPDSSVKAKIEMQGSGSEVFMNIENAQIGTSTDKDGFHVNDIDEYGNRTERVKLAKGEMFLSNENTGKEMLIGTDKIVFNQTAAGETTELATLNIELIPRMIFASDWSGMTESQKKAIPLAYIYDLNNTITNIYRYGGYAIPGTNVTLYASSVTSTDSRWTDMNNALGDTPSIFAYCNKYNEEPRLYLAFDVSTLPSNAIITQFTIEAKVKGALGWFTTNKIWGGVLWDGSEQWDWDIANNDTEQLRYTSRAGQFTKTQMTNMRALFRSDLNGNAAAGREVLVYYAKLTLTYVTQ